MYKNKYLRMDVCLNLLRETLTRLYIYILEILKKNIYIYISMDRNNLITDSNFTYSLKN